MAYDELSDETRAAALNSVLERHPDSVVAALADDGFRIPLPDTFALGAHQALAVPGSRQTMLDVVVPADRIAVVAAWERTRSHGVGVAPVHALNDPDTRLTLSMVDARSLYGVYMAVLAPDHEEPEAAPSLVAGPLVVPSRPRQATLHKSMTAIITEVDANVTRMFGWTSAQMVGCRSTESLPTGILQLHRDGSAAYANARLGAILDTGRPTCAGELLACVAPGDRPSVDSAIEAALTDGIDGELEVEVCSPRRPHSTRAGPTVIFVDVDNFKPINDRLGHAAGDELLTLIGRRLRTLCREQDVVGRLGGDEFLLVCHGVELRSGARAIADRIGNALCRPFALSSGPVKLRASIGIAWPERETTADALIARADAAMYEAKRSRDGVPVFAADVERARAA